MFTQKQKKGSENPAAYADKVSIVAAGMILRGDIESEGDIRIDGTVSGNISCKSKVVIIATGKVTGDIEAAQVDIHGQVNGNVTVSELLSLKAHCKIDGNLFTNKLLIEPNACFNGQCTMHQTLQAATVVNEAGILQEG